MGATPALVTRRLADRARSAAAGAAIAVVLIQHAALRHPAQITLRPPRAR